VSEKLVKVSLKLNDKFTKPLRTAQTGLDGFMKKKFEGFSALSQQFKAFSKQTGLNKLGKESVAFGKNIATGLGLAGVGAAGLLALVKQTADAGDALVNVAKRLDFGVEAFQEYQYAAEQSGVSSEDFTKGLEVFTRKIGEAKNGQGQLYSFLKKTNPELLKQVLGAKSNEEAFQMMTNSLGGVKDAQKQAAYSAMLFGKSGKNFTNLANEGSSGIEKLRETARSLGVMTEAQAVAADDFGDKWASIERLFQGLRNTMASGVIPQLQILADQLMTFVKSNQPLIQKFAQDFAEKLPSAIQTATDAFMGVISVAGALVDIFSWASDTFGSTTAVVGVLALTIGQGLTMAIGGVIKNLVLWIFTNTAMGASLVSTTVAAWSLNRSLGGGVVGSLGAATMATLKWTAALLANPTTWIVIGIVAAIAVLGYTIYKLWDNWAEVWTGIKNTTSAVFDWIMSSFDAIVSKFGSLRSMLPSWLGGKTTADVNVNNTGSSPATAVQNFGQAQSSKNESQVKVSFDNLPKGARVDSMGDKNVETEFRMGLMATSTI
jgi:hypothetical protein